MHARSYAKRARPRDPILDDPMVTRGGRVISPAETGAILQSGATRVNQLVQRGELKSYKDGRLRKIYLNSVLAYQARLGALPAAAKPKRGKR
jgi:hypothetical protein